MAVIDASFDEEEPDGDVDVEDEALKAKTLWSNEPTYTAPFETAGEE